MTHLHPTQQIETYQAYLDARHEYEMTQRTAWLLISGSIAIIIAIIAYSSLDADLFTFASFLAKGMALASVTPIMSYIIFNTIENTEGVN